MERNLITNFKFKIFIMNFFTTNLSAEWEGGIILEPCWFSLNNSETVKAVAMSFCSIQQTFIRDICAKLGIPNLPQCPGIGKISDEVISNFQISGQSLIKESCYNSRTRDDIHMKLVPVTKLHRRNKTISKNLTMTSFR